MHHHTILEHSVVGPKSETTAITTIEEVQIENDNSSDNSFACERGLLSNSNQVLHNTPDSPPSFSFPFIATLNAGSRAFESFVRPSLVVVAGRPTSHGFDMRACSFSLRMLPFEEIPPDDAPTEIFVPEYLYREAELDISVSTGQWTLHRSSQVLRWWHSGKEEQRLLIKSKYRRKGVVGVSKSIGQGYGSDKCRIM